VHLGVREIQAVCMKAVIEKEWKRKKLNWCSVFHWQKACNNARPPDTAKLWWKTIAYCQHWILHLVVFTRFPANRDCLLKLYMLVKSVEQFLVSFTWNNVSTLGLLHTVNWVRCDDTLLLCQTYLHAVYNRPMA